MCMYICVYTYRYMYMYICVCVCIHTHTHSFHNLFHNIQYPGLQQDIEYSSLCFTVGPCYFPILYILVCIC